MCPPPPPPNRPRSPPSNPRYFPTHINHNEELAWAIECNYDVSPPSHARPPHPHGLQGPISTSTSASSSSQKSGLISLDEQIVRAEAIDYDISPSGTPIIFLTPATDSSSTSFSSSFSDTDEAADSNTDDEADSNTHEAADSDTDEAADSNTDDEADSDTDEEAVSNRGDEVDSDMDKEADSDTNEAANSDKDEAADIDTNDAVNPNLTVTPSYIAVVPPSPGTNEAVSSSINGTTTTAANNPAHGTSSVPSKEECGFCKNSRALLLPESSTTTTHIQGLQNPDACQIGDNEDWDILLSNLNEKNPKDLDEYTEWLKGRMELGQGQGQGQVRRDDEPIRVEIFGTVCPFHRQLMMWMLDESDERKKKKKDKGKERPEQPLPVAPSPSYSSPTAGGSPSTTPTNRAPSNSPTFVSSPASTIPSTTPPKSPLASSPVINSSAATSTTSTSTTSTSSTSTSTFSTSITAIIDNRPEFEFPTLFEIQFKAQCRNLSWCQFWEEDNRLSSIHFRSSEGEYEVRRFVDWLSKEGPEVVHGIEVLDESVHQIACLYHRLMRMMELGYGNDEAYREEKAKARVRTREMAKEMARVRMGELTAMPVFLSPPPSIAVRRSASNVATNSPASSGSSSTVSVSPIPLASYTPCRTPPLSISTTPATTPPRSPRASSPLNSNSCNNNINYNHFRYPQSLDQLPPRLRLQPRGRPCSTNHHLNQPLVYPPSPLKTSSSFAVKDSFSSSLISPVKKQNLRYNQHPLQLRRHYPDSCVEDLYDLFLQEPSPMQRWTNRAQPGWRVLAAVYRDLSRTCHRTVDKSPITWLYRRFWRDRFGFEEYHVVGFGGFKRDGYDSGRVRNDPRIYEGGGVGQGLDEADTPASQIEVFGKGAQIRRRRFESYRRLHLQAEADESPTGIVGGWVSKMECLARWIVSGSPLVQEVAGSVSFFQSHQTDEQRVYYHPKDNYDYASSDDDNDDNDDDDDHDEYDNEGDALVHESSPAEVADDSLEGSFLQTTRNPSISLVPCSCLF